MKFQGNGRVSLAVRDTNGHPGVFRFVGCTDALKTDLSLDTFEHIEKCTGNYGIDYRGVKGKKMNVSMDLTEIDKYNLAFALNGTVNGVGSPGTVTVETLPTGILVGDVYALGSDTGIMHQAITTLVITDSTGSPITLANGTDYTFDVTTGLVTFLTVTGVQPYKAAYGYTQAAMVSIFTAGTQEVWLRYDYINVANASAKGLVNLYRVRFDPTTGLELVNDELMTLSLTGAVLLDDKKSPSGVLGQFGNFTTTALS
jgi:hypothetical protein